MLEATLARALPASTKAGTTQGRRPAGMLSFATASALAKPLIDAVRSATGDGQTDDTAAIQAAIDEIAGTGGTVLVPNGTYIVDAVGKNSLALKSEMTLKMSESATLRAIPNSSKRYAVLSI